MLVTAMTGPVWTVTRGIEGTTAIAHTTGAAVNHVMSAGGLTQAITDAVVGRTGSGVQSTSGPVANLPSTAAAGDEYLPSDSAYKYRYNGSVWEALGSIYKMTPPTLGDFAWVNQGSATTSTNGVLVMSESNHGDTYNRRMLMKSVPSTPYTIIIQLIPTLFPGNWPGCGVIWRNSTSGKTVDIGWRSYMGNIMFHSSQFNNPTDGVANYFTYSNASNFIASSVMTVRLTDQGVGGNRIVEINNDPGLNDHSWVIVHSVFKNRLDHC